MNPKVKALVWSLGLVVISFGCAWVAWSAGSKQFGFLALFLKFIAVIFFLTAVGAIVALVNFSMTSKEALSKPKPKKKQDASAKAATRSSHAPAEFSFGNDDATEEMPTAAKLPRPAPKKAARPVSGSEKEAPRKAPRPVGKPSPKIGPPE